MSTRSACPKPRSHLRGVHVAAAVGLILSAIGSRGAVLTPAQIEADWLLQAELRLSVLAQSPQGTVSAQQDAGGAVDGIVDGKWGFHTAHENEPWWQVDLGTPTALERVVLYNRCDSCGERNRRIKVLLALEDARFSQVYQHDGTMFRGKTDGKPLVVKLDGQPARYVRLQLPGTSYFHLDEVQVLAVGSDANIALQKPADQSSISQWSAASKAPTRWPAIVEVVLSSGAKLAQALQRLGLNTSVQVAVLDQVGASSRSEPDSKSAAQWQALYVKARWAVRRMALANPLLDFDTILFVKRAPTMFPHISDQYYGWWSRPGGGIYLLEDFTTDSVRLTCLTDSFESGNFLRPELDYDGSKVLFSYCRHYPDVPNIGDKVNKANLPEDAFYHLYEIDLAGTAAHRLTRGKYDDFDGRYLPGGDIAFLSTRKGNFLQCTRANTQRTLTEALPDSYVRCGGGNSRPVPVFTLHAIDADGGNMRPISAFETFEYTPSIAHDGRILYCRWDYIDRFNGHFFSLWSTNPDGTNAQLVYGNYTRRPQATLEARAIPGSEKLVFTASAHHSVTGGSLVLLDRTRGQEGEGPITRLTPEVPFPETESNVEMYYANPWPLSEDFYLVSWSNRKLPPHSRCTDERNPVDAQGLYLYDRFGNLELLHRDPDISSMCPLPLRPRPRPRAYPALAARDGRQVGAFLVQNVITGLSPLEKGAVSRLRIVGVPPKVQPQKNRPSLGVSQEETGKFILGTVPVEEDGSAHFSVPSGVSVFFQALDNRGRAVQTMRSLTYVAPGQTLSCVGCHEQRQQPPAPGAVPLAAQRAPARLRPDPVGTLPLRYDQLVQPVLDQHCVRCHSPGSGNPKAAHLDLTPATSYNALLAYADDDLKKLVFERDRSDVNQTPSLQCKLLKHLRHSASHQAIKLDSSALKRLYAWMDTYGHTQGCFSQEQERELIAFRSQYADLFEPPE